MGEYQKRPAAPFCQQYSTVWQMTSAQVLNLKFITMTKHLTKAAGKHDGQLQICCLCKLRILQVWSFNSWILALNLKA